MTKSEEREMTGRLEKARRIEKQMELLMDAQVAISHPLDDPELFQSQKDTVYEACRDNAPIVGALFTKLIEQLMKKYKEV